MPPTTHNHAARSSHPWRPKFTVRPPPQLRTRFTRDERPTTLSGPQRLAPSSQHLSRRCPGDLATHCRRTVAQNGRSAYQIGAPGPDALSLRHSGMPLNPPEQSSISLSSTKKLGWFSDQSCVPNDRLSQQSMSVVSFPPVVWPLDWFLSSFSSTVCPFPFTILAPSGPRSFPLHSLDIALLASPLHTAPLCRTPGVQSLLVDSGHSGTLLSAYR